MKYFLALLLVACAVPKTIVEPAEPHRWNVGDAMQSTLKIDLGNGSSGTGWVARNDGYSLIVTAGHVCDDEAEFTLIDAGGHEYPATLHYRSAFYDLCALRADKMIAPPLPVSWTSPYYDEPVMAVGAPLGVYGCYGGSSLDECGMAPISRGYYAGGNLVSMPMTGGNSGSAVFTSRGVIGVLVEGYRGFDSLSFIEPRIHLTTFLDSI